MFFSREFEIAAPQVQGFADLVSDHNPLHLDPLFAATTRYRQPICHGMLVASYISGCLTECFGGGTVYLEQSVKFQRPVPIGSRIRVVFEQPEKVEENRLRVPTHIELQRGSLWKRAVEGTALIEPGE